MKIIIPGFLSRLYLWVLRQFTEPCNTTLINYYMGLMWESNESPVANEKYNHLSILIPSDSPVQSLSKFSIYIGGAGGINHLQFWLAGVLLFLLYRTQAARAGWGGCSYIINLLPKESIIHTTYQSKTLWDLQALRWFMLKNYLFPQYIPYKTFYH